MSSTPAVKLGGVAGVLAAMLFIISTILDQVAPAQSVYESATDYIYQVVTTVAFLAVIGAVVGLWALQQRTGQFRRLGTVAAGLAAVGYAVVALVNAIGIIQGERSLVTLRIVAVLGLLIGSAILGFIVLRTGVLPWWCGVLLIVAFPLGDISNELFRGAEGILLALLWGSVGIALLARRQEVTEPVVTQPARTG